eukprot:6686901-Ditylum_brightwellii.AAC.1
MRVEEIIVLDDDNSDGLNVFMSRPKKVKKEEVKIKKEDVVKIKKEDSNKKEKEENVVASLNGVTQKKNKKRKTEIHFYVITEF